jgi:hypothetical protein
MSQQCADGKQPDGQGRDVGPVGLDFHSLPTLSATRGRVETHPLDFDHTDTARTDQAQVGVVAESRDAVLARDSLLANCVSEIHHSIPDGPHLLDSL